MKIGILEDNVDRQQVMRDCLADRFPMYDIRFFDDAVEMIRFLEAHRADMLVISLDHDLELKAGPNGRCIDPGTGRDVADFLASKRPVCPIVIHTSNTNAALAMQTVLKDAGWKIRRVMPMEDTQWVIDQWFPSIRRAIVGPIGANRAARGLSKDASPASKPTS
jgi:CheY-like chemotaxis protein